MYSVVLLTALSAGGGSPAWICNGCYGGGYYGCCGGCYGCSGCYGGGGGCYGCSGCSGCWGCTGCHGCFGGHGGHHFLGHLFGHWCHGGCHGCYGPQGCWGGFHAGCAGCYGGWYGYGYPGGYIVPGAPAGATTPTAPGATTPNKMSPAGEPGTPAKTGSGTTTSIPKPARLIVQVPEDAKLYVDDRAMTTTTAKRTFRTPELKPGQTYYYIVRAELIRDGKTYNQTRQILLRAGDEIQTSFPDLEKVISATARRN